MEKEKRRRWKILLGSWIIGLLVLSVPVIAEEIENHVSGEYTYTINEDGSATITEYDDAKKEMIVIPEQLDGINVTVIGKKSFNTLDANTVVIPDSITDIEDSAFEYSFSLSEINIPASAKHIGINPFAYCGIEHFVIDENNQFFEIDSEALIEK